MKEQSIFYSAITGGKLSEFAEFMEQVIRFAAQTLECVLPAPETQLNMYPEQEQDTLTAEDEQSPPYDTNYERQINDLHDKLGEQFFKEI